MSDHLKTAFRVATSPKLLGWSPEVFWRATAVEFEMALEGLSGKLSGAPFISREEVRRAAAAYGVRPSIKTNPKAQTIGGG
ncbi:phage tail assembly chaperone [Ensifer adhaerens]|uniref:phage tail assembly chaperone n=1 Tax=Ensifer adhaerens TaxID=106592 RepID=UPI002101B71C|nr:phage tail assembly chaperone [Ensifer adhaerens]UTV38633.1 phage tail assembly chaperone [Ensifer adhaerens]